MSLTRRAALVAAALGLVVALISPAGARQTIVYRGEHSQGGKVQVAVLKKDSGARVIGFFGIRRITATCEDATIQRVTVQDFLSKKLAEDGTFEVTRYVGSTFGTEFRVTIAGDIGFGSASGTYEFRYANLDAAGEPQLCSTGELTWTAERRRDGSLGLPREGTRVVVR